MSKWNCGLALGLCLSVAGTASAQNKTLIYIIGACVFLGVCMVITAVIVAG